MSDGRHEVMDLHPEDLPHVQLYEVKLFVESIEVNNTGLRLWIMLIKGWDSACFGKIGLGVGMNYGCHALVVSVKKTRLQHAAVKMGFDSIRSMDLSYFRKQVLFVSSEWICQFQSLGLRLIEAALIVDDCGLMSSFRCLHGRSPILAIEFWP